MFGIPDLETFDQVFTDSSLPGGKRMKGIHYRNDVVRETLVPTLMRFQERKLLKFFAMQ